MLIDSHCHLNSLDFQKDLPQVITRAQQASIDMMLSIAVNLDEVADITHIASQYPFILYSVGVHPLEVQNHPDLETETLIELTNHPKAVGLGETGLDFYRNRDHEALQKRLFRIHIQAARQTGLPVIIHSRAADKEMAQILTQEKEKGDFPALMHCFTASAELAEIALNLGLYISFSGIITFKNAQDLRDIAQTIPEDRLLIDTDAPFLAPEPHRGKRNEPAFVIHTAQQLAEIRSVPTSQISQITRNNFLQLFSKAQQHIA